MRKSFPLISKFLFIICIFVPLLLLGTLSLGEYRADVKRENAPVTDMLKLIPDHTYFVIIIDLDNVYESPAAKQILGKDKILPFLKKQIRKVNPEFKDLNSPWFSVIEGVVETSKRMTYIITSKKDDDWFPTIACFLEGKYDADKLLIDIKRVAKSEKAAFKVETHDACELITTDGFCTCVIGESILVFAGLKEPEKLITTTLSRVDRKSSPKLHNDLAVALKQMPQKLPITVAGIFALDKDKKITCPIVGGIALGEKNIAMTLTYLLPTEADAEKHEITQVAEMRKKAIEIAKGFGNLQGLIEPVKSAKVERLGKNVSVEIAIPIDDFKASLPEILKMIR